MDAKDIYWLAGLIEGEGSFTFLQNNKNKIPVVSVSMIDEDVIKRVAIIFKTNVTYTVSGGSLMYNTRIRGNIAIQWMMTLYSLMGSRRKTKIREIMKFWKATHYRLSPVGHRNRIAST